MRVFGLDPGTEVSACVEWDSETQRVGKHWSTENGALLQWLAVNNHVLPHVLVIERIASYGMAVGQEVFETVFWSGRFYQMWPRNRHDRIFRREIKLHLCHDSRAKDANIRQALIDRFGGKEKAIGRKANPGILYGIRGDEWQALACAITYADQHKETQ